MTGIFFIFNLVIYIIAYNTLKKSNAIFVLFSKIQYEKVLYFRYYFKEFSFHLKMINEISLAKGLFEFQFKKKVNKFKRNKIRDFNASQ